MHYPISSGARIISDYRTEGMVTIKVWLLQCDRLPPHANQGYLDTVSKP